MDGSQQHSMRAQAIDLSLCLILYTCLELYLGGFVYKVWASRVLKKP